MLNDALVWLSDLRVALAFGVVLYAVIIARCWRVAARWLPANYFRLIAGLAVFLAPAWIWLVYEILREIATLIGGSNAGKEALERRNIAYALGVNITALAALLAAPLIIIRAWIYEKQAVVATRQAETAEQGLITDRFTRAVEQLGTEKTVKYLSRTVTFIIRAGEQPDRHMKTTLREGHEPDFPEGAMDIHPGYWETLDETLPNLEVRLGAIYALERIAQDSERDHIPIMETLCAYIRENAPGKDAVDHGLGDWPDWINDANDAAYAEREEKLSERRKALRKWATALPAPRVDIQAALSVIGRRGEERIAHERRQRRGDRKDNPGFRLDLRGANLQHADLTRARLDHALLTGSRLELADLWRARLKSSDLSRTRLEGADIENARLEWASLRGAPLEGASLLGARLERADLRSANLTDAMYLTQDQINVAFGDRATILPAGIAMPDHWDGGTGIVIVGDPKYDAWRDAGAMPSKPPQAPPG